MKLFDVQAIEIRNSRETVFEFLRNPANLPRWAHAFVSADDRRANLRTPAGTAEITLRVDADARCGTVDWLLGFPDGSVGHAHSRVTETSRGTCIYTFVLHAPPVPLEQIEGALEVQRTTLHSELALLKSILEQA